MWVSCNVVAWSSSRSLKHSVRPKEIWLWFSRQSVCMWVCAFVPKVDPIDTMTTVQMVERAKSKCWQSWSFSWYSHIWKWTRHTYVCITTHRSERKRQNDRKADTNTWARERFERDGESENWSKRNEAFAHKLVLAFPSFTEYHFHWNSRKCRFSTRSSLKSVIFEIIRPFRFPRTPLRRYAGGLPRKHKSYFQNNGYFGIISHGSCHRLEMPFMTTKWNEPHWTTEWVAWMRVSKAFHLMACVCIEISALSQ